MDLNIKLLLYVPTLLTTLLLALLVFLSSKKNKINKVFSALILGSSLWLFFLMIADTTKGINLAFWCTRLGIIGPLIIPIMFLYFSFWFPRDRHNLSKNFFYILFSPFILLFVLSFTNLNVKSVVIEPWGVNPDVGILYPIFFVYFIIYILIGLFNFISTYKDQKTSNNDKLQIRYVLFGFLTTSILVVIPNVFFVSLGISKYFIFSVPSILIFLGFATYSITKHHLMGIKVILTEVFVGIIGILLFAQMFTAGDISHAIFHGITLLLYCYFAYLLIKSVLNEIHQREELAKLNKELRKAYKELIAVDEAKDEFISIASHELKSPVAVIEGYASMVLSQKLGTISKNTSDAVNKIYSASRYLGSLTKDLLDISRISLGRLQVEKSKVDLVSFLTEIVGRNAIRGDEAGVKLTLIKPKNKKINSYIDPTRISQVINNLITNAIKFTPKNGKITVNMEVSADKSGVGMATISVADTGVGIPQEALPHLFEKFYQVAPSAQREKGGSGLGLYISKSIIEIHGGKIWAESKVGQGSTFKFTLPIMAE